MIKLQLRKRPLVFALAYLLV